MTKSPSAAARSRRSMVCPGLQIVRQRDRAEIAPKRRADFGGGSQHRGDAGLDMDVELAPGRIASSRPPRTPPPPSRTRRDRRRRPQRLCRPRRRASAHAAPDRVRRGCRRRGGAGRGRSSMNAIEIGAIADEIGRARKRARRGRRQQVSDPGPRPTTTASRSQPPPLAGNQHHRKIWTAGLAALRQRHDLLAIHGAALDIDRARQQAGRATARRTFARLLPTFMITAASVSARRRVNCCLAHACPAAPTAHRRPR